MYQALQNLVHEVLGQQHMFDAAATSPIEAQEQLPHHQSNSATGNNKLDAIQKRLQMILQKHNCPQIDGFAANDHHANIENQLKEKREILLGNGHSQSLIHKSIDQLISTPIGIMPSVFATTPQSPTSAGSSLMNFPNSPQPHEAPALPFSFDANTLTHNIIKLYKKVNQDSLIVCRGVIESKTAKHISIQLRSLFLCSKQARQQQLQHHAIVLRVLPDFANIQLFDLKAVLPMSELDDPKLHEQYKIGDEVFSILLTVEDPQARITLSMNSLRVKNVNCKLGHCSSIDKDIQYETEQQQSSPETALTNTFLRDRFNEMIRYDSNFYNPSKLDDLVSCYNVSSNESLIPSLRQFEPADFFLAMRTQQNKLYAHENVILGLEIVRKGLDFEKALEYFNKALEFDPENSDALVGRGVIFFNRKDFKNALVEFEMAVRHDAENKNAKLYLQQTQAKIEEIEKEREKEKQHKIEQILSLKGIDESSSREEKKKKKKKKKSKNHSSSDDEEKKKKKKKKRKSEGDRSDSDSDSDKKKRKKRRSTSNSPKKASPSNADQKNQQQ